MPKAVLFTTSHRLRAPQSFLVSRSELYLRGRDVLARRHLDGSPVKPRLSAHRTNGLVRTKLTSVPEAFKPKAAVLGSFPAGMFQL